MASPSKQSIFKGEGPRIVIREDDLLAHHSVAKGVGGAFEISQVTRTQSAFEILQVTRTPPTPFTCVSRQHEPMCLDPCAIEDDARGRGGERSIRYKCVFSPYSNGHFTHQIRKRPHLVAILSRAHLLRTLAAASPHTPVPRHTLTSRHRQAPQARPRCHHAHLPPHEARTSENVRLNIRRSLVRSQPSSSASFSRKY